MIEERNPLEDEYTIEGTIQKGREITLLYNNLSLLTRLSDEEGKNKIDTPMENIIYDYLDELKKLSIMIQLSDEEFLRYQYRPDLLSYDMYGTMTYDYIILALNDIISPKYFTKKKLWMIPSEYIENVLSDIYSAEKEYIDYNRAHYENIEY